MATSAAAVKAPTAGELKRLQERASKAQATAQELDDATFLALQEQASRAEVEALKANLASAMEDASQLDPEELRHSFSDAVKDLGKSKDMEAEAAALKDHALVIMSRRAFQASIHPAIVGKGKQNISKAGEFLGMPYSTVRPYVLAGGALFQHDRAFLLSAPEAEDARIVNDSFNANSRKAQIEKRQRAAVKAQQQAELLAQQQAEIETLKQQQAQQQQQQAGAGAGAGEQQAGAGEQQQQAGTSAFLPEGAMTGVQAPAQETGAAAQAPAAQQEQEQQAPAAGPSLSDDILSTARLLVKQAKQQRSSDKAGWQKTHAELTAILSDLFPVLK